MNGWRDSERDARQLSYPWSHLLPPFRMFRVISLTEDVVPPVLDSCGLVVPIGALVARLVVYVHPNLGRRCDQHLGCDTGDRTWLKSNMLASYSRYSTLAEMQSKRDA